MYIFNLKNIKKRLKEAFDCINIAIAKLTKAKNFSLLIAAWYGHNIILRWLGSATDKYSIDAKKIDIEDRFNHLPVTIRRDTRLMFETIMGNKISALYHELSEIRSEKEAKLVKAGGIAIDGNRLMHFAKYKNFVQFVINNCLFMDDDNIYRDTAKMAIGIHLAQHALDKTVELDTFHIYVCIKLFGTEKLSQIFSRFIDISDKDRGQITMSDENAKVFIEEIFFNLMDMYLECAPMSKCETYIANLYFLLGIVTLTQKLVDKIAERTLEVIKSRSCTFVFLEAVNGFFGCQFNLHDIVVDKALDIVEAMIERFVQGAASHSETDALQRGTINNLLGLCISWG